MQFSCTDCDSNFKNKSDLEKHVEKHKEKSFSCQKCDKKFKRLNELKKHEKVHKTVTCEACDKKVPEPPNFKSEKPFRCLLKSCLKRFRYKGDLSKHIKKYHPGHTQELTPVPPQEDELLNLQNQSSVATGTFKTLQPSATATTASAARR